MISQEKSAWLGIDPGQSGGYGIYYSPTEYYAFKYDTAVWEIAEELRKHPIEFAILEKVSAMPKQGVSSTFKFGTNYGIWQGILGALGIPYSLETPTAWRKLARVKLKPSKQELVEEATRRFPKENFYGPKGGLSDGPAEALLMAFASFKIMNGEKQ